MGLVNSPDYLPEQMPSAGLPQSPSGPDVGVEVSVTRREHQVDVFLAHHDLLKKVRGVLISCLVTRPKYKGTHLYRVDVRMTVHSVVRREEALTRSFPTDHLRNDFIRSSISFQI